MMKKIFAILLAAMLIVGMLSACGEAPAQNTETKPDAVVETTEQPAIETETTQEETPAVDDAALQDAINKLTVSLVSPTVEAGTESVTVPVKISANPGLAGAFVTVQYDEALKLTDVKAGGALGSLTFTPGGDLSANPFNLLWDGQDADTSNGDIALLTFELPKNAGEYKISLGGDPQSFYDNELKDVPVSFVDGGITVTAKG